MKEKLSTHSRTYGQELVFYDNGNVESSVLHDENGVRINAYDKYENLQVKDSIFYNEKGDIDSAFHYFENGNLQAIYYAKSGNRPDSLIAFTVTGRKLNNVRYLLNSEMKGGDKEWSKFLRTNLNASIPIDKGAPKGQYEVLVKFCIGKDGAINDVIPVTKYGYGMELEAVRVIKKSPAWTPEVFLGEPRLSYRIQPISFIVNEN